MPCFVNIIRKMELPHILFLSASHCIKCFCNFIRIFSLQILLSCEIGTANRNITFPFTVVAEKYPFLTWAEAKLLSLLWQETVGKILTNSIQTAKTRFFRNGTFHQGLNSERGWSCTIAEFLWLKMKVVGARLERGMPVPSCIRNWDYKYKY